MSLIAELKQRKLVQWMLAYATGAWLLLQVIGLIGAQFNWAPGVMRGITIAAGVGFFVALLLAWYHGERGAQKVSGTELLLLAMLLAIGAGLLWKFAPGQPAVTTAAAVPVAAQPAAPAEAPPAPAASQKSIAVLAFVDLSSTKDQEYFSDGIAEEILNALAQVKGLKVAGRTSAFSFKGRNVDLREIGKALGVANILEGSVRKQGDKVRITAQLIQTSDGSHLWSKTFDGELSDVFELQEKIARSITDQLQVVLEGEQKSRLVPIATSSTEAYALYLRATAIFDRRDGPRMAESVQQLQQAIALDPNYARAYSRLAAVSWVQPIFTGSDPAMAFQQSRAHAHRATELDPRLAEPWAVLGLAASAESGAGMLQAREYFDKALLLEPDDVTSNFWYGLTLIRSGYTQAGVARIEHALAVDPLVPNVMRWRGVIHLRAGETDRAEPYLKRAYASGLAIAARELSEIAVLRGDASAARPLWTEGSAALLVRTPPGFDEAVATALFGGSTADRQRGLAAIDAYVAAKPVNIASVIPLWIAQLGEGARALEVERTLVKTDNSDFMAYLFSASGKWVRALPEFPGYLVAKGFPALWDRYGAPDVCRKATSGEYACD